MLLLLTMLDVVWIVATPALKTLVLEEVFYVARCSIPQDACSRGVASTDAKTCQSLKTLVLEVYFVLDPARRTNDCGKRKTM